MSDLKSDVRELLQRNGASPSALPLWEEIYTSFEQESPEAVTDLLESKVKAIRKSAKAEASEMRAAAGSVKRKSRSKKR
jgi:hypothetical protein